MEIQVITQTTTSKDTIPTFGISDSLDSTRNFGLFLKKAISTLHMVHWYVLNYDVHVILGDLYKSLDKQFDSLQEEIIGTCRQSGQTFPNFNPAVFDLENISQYKDDTSRIIDTYQYVYTTVTNALRSTEFNGYVSSVKSGINNTVEGIISDFNKANYLLSMVKD